MKYKLILSSRFKKGLKSAKKHGLNISLLEPIVETLLQGKILDKKSPFSELCTQGK